MSIKEKIIKIMSLAVEICDPTINSIGKNKTAAFVEYYPHTNTLDLRIYYGGWKADIKPETFIIYCDFEDANRVLDNAIEKLKKIEGGYEG